MFTLMFVKYVYRIKHAYVGEYISLVAPFVEVENNYWKERTIRFEKLWNYEVPFL